MNHQVWQKVALATGGFLGSLAVFQANPVQAAIITYDFKVVNVTGVLSGKTFNGSFSFDDTNFKRQGFESVCDLVNCDDAFTTFTHFEFNFLGKTFTQFDDIFRRTSVFFKDGTPTVVYHRPSYDYQTLPESKGSPVVFALSGWDVDMEGNSIYRDFGYQFDELGGYRGSGNGDVIIKERKPPVKSTPEPTTIMALSLVGLGGLVVGKKKR